MINPLDIAMEKVEEYKNDVKLHNFYTNSLNTWLHSGDLFVKNAKRNKHLPYKDIESIKDLYKGKTISLVAFGPSLRRNYEDLIDKDNVIGVDRGYYWYRERNIDPDFIIAMDARVLKSFIGNSDIKGKKLVAHVATNHDFCKEWSDRGGEIYFYNAECSIKSDLVYKDIFDRELSYVNALCNVANGLIALSAEVLKPEKINLYGFDHSWDKDFYYPDEKYKWDKKEKVFRTKNKSGKIIYYNNQMNFYAEQIKLMIYYYGLQNKIKDLSDGLLKLN